MKRFLSAVLILSLLLVTGIPALAQESVIEHFSGDFRYKVLEDGTVSITNYVGQDESVTIPSKIDRKKVTEIGDRCFDSCHFSSVSIPEGIKKIGCETFYFCSQLNSIELPDSLEEIGTRAFTGCHFSSIRLPDNISYLGQNPFGGCFGFKEFIVSPNHKYLEVKDGVLFSKPDKRLICWPDAKVESSYVIPSGTEIIGDGAFYYCNYLERVTIPDSIECIYNDSFYGDYETVLNVMELSCGEKFARDNFMKYAYVSSGFRGPTEKAFVTTYEEMASRAECNKIPMKGADASSELKSAFAGKADYAIDDNPETYWAEGTSGHSCEDSITVYLNSMSAISMICFRMGNAYNDVSFAAQDRPRHIRVYFSDGSIAEGEFPDDNAKYVLALNYPVYAEWFRVDVEDIYMGSSGTDCCISEITPYETE